MLPPLLPCHTLDYLGWQLLDQPFIFYIFSSFHPSLPRFPHGVYNYFAVSCASSPRFRPPRSYPVPAILVPASVLVPVPVLIRCSSTGLHPRPHPRSRPVPAPVPVPILRFLCVCVCVYVCVCSMQRQPTVAPVSCIPSRGRTENSLAHDDIACEVQEALGRVS